MQRIDWTRQPQYSVELSRGSLYITGLTAAFNFAAGNRNYALNTNGTVTDSGTLNVSPGGVGKGLLASNGLRSISDPSGLHSVAGPATHMGVVQLSSLDNPWGGVFAISDSSSVSNFTLQRNNATGELVVFINSSPGVYQAFASTSVAALVDGRPHVWAVTKASATDPAGLRLYIDGREIAKSGASGTASAPSLANTNFRFLSARDASTAYSADGYYFAHFAWNRVLLPVEVEALSRNPWQLFQPLPRRVFAVNTATGGGGLVANPLFGGGTAANPLWGYIA